MVSLAIQQIPWGFAVVLAREKRAYERLFEDVWWLILLALLAGAALQFWKYRRELMRGDELRAMAERLGFSFQARDGPSALQELLEQPWGTAWLGSVRVASFHDTVGRSGIRNVLHKQLGGAEVIAFDYEFGSGKKRSQQTAACFRLPQAALPEFRLRPEERSFLLDKLESLFRMQDIDFPSQPEFSANYHLKGAEEAAVRNLFHQGVLEFFAAHPDWIVEGGGRWLVVYRWAFRPRPEQVPAFLSLAVRMVRLLAAADSASLKPLVELSADPEPFSESLTQGRRRAQRATTVFFAAIVLALLAFFFFMLRTLFR